MRERREGERDNKRERREGEIEEIVIEIGR